jgi:hypothetical protein
LTAAEEEGQCSNHDDQHEYQQHNGNGCSCVPPLPKAGGVG